MFKSKTTVTAEGWVLLGMLVITGICSMICTSKPTATVTEKPKSKPYKPFTISNIPYYENDGDY